MEGGGGAPSEYFEIGMLFNVLIFEKCLAGSMGTRNCCRPGIHDLNSEMGGDTSLANSVTS